MTPRTFRWSCAVIWPLAVATAWAGGWAVVTVKDLPAYVIAGKPVQLTFAVRSHGQRLSHGLTGFVEARSGSRLVRAKAESEAHGSYSVTLVFPQAGEWQVTVDSGYSTNGGGMIRFPLTVVSEGGTAPVFSAEERGRRLFVAKGCMTCHVHTSAPSNHPSPVGPVLTGKRYPPDYLRRVLVDPTFLPGAPVETSEGPWAWKMSDLDLAPAEIEALMAFINGGSRAAS
jgi:hypothetical protein